MGEFIGLLIIAAIFAGFITAVLGILLPTWLVAGALTIFAILNTIGYTGDGGIPLCIGFIVGAWLVANVWSGPRSIAELFAGILGGIIGWKMFDGK